MRTPCIMGNWKLNGDKAFTQNLIKGVMAQTQHVNCDVVVCPPFVFVQNAVMAAANSHVKVGAQNVATEVSGAYTGEVSAPMLKDVGCEYVIIGHSERRQYYGDTDEVVVQKVRQTLGAGLVPVLCMGETQKEHESGNTEQVVGGQLQAVLSAFDASELQNMIVAYEPVWAIGTGLTATPEQAQAVHAFLRGLITAKDESLGASTRILYGGSMKPDNAPELLAQPDIDGGLIGGAALKVDMFAGICAAAY
jgi:triosephosphate isomerase